MPDERCEILVRLQRDASGRWQIFPLSVGPDTVLEMLLNPSSAESAISRLAHERLADTTCLERAAVRRYRMHELAVQGQPLPDLQVRVSVGPALLGLDGILGRDFFLRFESVAWYPREGSDTDLLRLYSP